MSLQRSFDLIITVDVPTVKPVATATHHLLDKRPARRCIRKTRHIRTRIELQSRLHKRSRFAFIATLTAVQADTPCSAWDTLQVAGPRESVFELAIAWATGLNVGCGEGETGDMRDAVVAHIEGDGTAVGEVRCATDLHVRVVVEVVECRFNVVHAGGIVVLTVTGKYSCASLSSAEPLVDYVTPCVDVRSIVVVGDSIVILLESVETVLARDVATSRRPLVVM